MNGALPICLQQLHFRDDIHQPCAAVLSNRNACLKLEPRRQPLLHYFSRQIPIEHHAAQHRHVTLHQQCRLVKRKSRLVIPKFDGDLVILKCKVHSQSRILCIPKLLRDQLYRIRRHGLPRHLLFGHEIRETQKVIEHLRLAEHFLDRRPPEPTVRLRYHRLLKLHVDQLPDGLIVRDFQANGDRIERRRLVPRRHQRTECGIVRVIELLEHQPPCGLQDRHEHQPIALRPRLHLGDDLIGHDRSK